ncbi:MAG TPA: tetraacyldisaccharide 4'-kinase [bacterium]|nr:tetraacyldisaccharide 4'-kinase [bacterium]
MAWNIERYFLDVINNRTPGLAAGSLRKLLFVLSKIYGFIVLLRYFFYRHGIFRRKTLGCVIISIGNITVGGTGKTPLVEMFARALSDGGRKVAVLSRGYKRKKRSRLSGLLRGEWHEPPGIVSTGEKLLMTSADAGDEPYMLARNLKGVSVIVGKDRVRSGGYAIEMLGADTLILDDGFQYLPLNRRLDIVLVDATNPFGNGHLLPRGILREPRRNLKRADIFFITKAKETDTAPVRERIRAYNTRAEIVECYYEPRYFADVSGTQRYDLSYVQGKQVAVISAIADPEGFETSIRRLGATVRATYRYADHYRYTREDIDVVIRELGKNVDCIVTTEKDSVRFPNAFPGALPMIYLRVDVKIINGSRDFSDCVARLCNF